MDTAHQPTASQRGVPDALELLARLSESVTASTAAILSETVTASTAAILSETVTASTAAILFEPPARLDAAHTALAQLAVAQRRAKAWCAAAGVAHPGRYRGRFPLAPWRLGWVLFVPCSSELRPPAAPACRLHPLAVVTDRRRPLAPPTPPARHLAALTIAPGAPGAAVLA